MIVDNTSKLKDILVFKPNTYYKFVVLLREKDGKTLLQSYNKKELIVRQWLVDSQEKLDEMEKNGMIIKKGNGYSANPGCKL